MLFVHAPALVGMWRALLSDGPDALGVSSFAALNLSMLFFALKVGRLRLLDLETNRRSLFVLTLAVALMHANVCKASFGVAEVPNEVPLVAGALFAAGLSSVHRVLRSVLAHRRDSSDQASTLSWRLSLRAVQVERLLTATRVCPSRAPPIAIPIR